MFLLNSFEVLLNQQEIFVWNNFFKKSLQKYVVVIWKEEYTIKEKGRKLNKPKSLKEVQSLWKACILLVILVLVYKNGSYYMYFIIWFPPA